MLCPGLGNGSVSLKIEITGAEDRTGPWKLAVAGFAGAGKTMFASTAPNPLFVFFKESPRIKSIADRHVPHMKIVNEVDGKTLVASVQDQLKMLYTYLVAADLDYQTIVFDTGDELQQEMKAARRIRNGGEFGPGDWQWLADTYREIVTSFIDLPLNIIVLYHLRSASDDDSSWRELALQGSSKDEAPGWFDVVAALDTFEFVNEEGESETRRALLTHSSRQYPWVKDHSGSLPPRFMLSTSFVGDYDNLYTVLTSGDSWTELEGTERVVVEVVPPVPEEKEKSKLEVVTPDELQTKKRGRPKKEPSIPAPEPAPVVPDAGEVPVQESVPGQVEVPIPSPPEPSVVQMTEAVLVAQPEMPADLPTEEAAMEAAVELAKKELGAEEIEFACAVCGLEVEDDDLREISQIRFRMFLCREHFKEKLANTRR